MDLFGNSDLRAGKGSDEWLTPKWITDTLGPFDVDPCSPGDRRPWDTARIHYSLKDDGMRQPWEGRIWLNPPYSNARRWLARLAQHGTGTALIFARTETGIWHDHVWPHAAAMLFLRGRLAFHYVTGKPASASAGAPSVLVAYGNVDAERLATSGIRGHFVDLRKAAA